MSEITYYRLKPRRSIDLPNGEFWAKNQQAIAVTDWERQNILDGQMTKLVPLEEAPAKVTPLPEPYASRAREEAEVIVPVTKEEDPEPKTTKKKATKKKATKKAAVAAPEGDSPPVEDGSD